MCYQTGQVYLLLTLKKVGWHEPFMLDLIRTAFNVQKR